MRIDTGDIDALVATGIDGIKTVLTALNNFAPHPENLATTTALDQLSLSRKMTLGTWTLHVPINMTTSDKIAAVKVPKYQYRYFTTLDLEASAYTASSTFATTPDVHLYVNDSSVANVTLVAVDTTYRSTVYAVPVSPGDELSIRVVSGADVLYPLVVSVSGIVQLFDAPITGIVSQ